MTSSAQTSSGPTSPGLKRLLYFTIAVFIAHQVIFLGIYKPMTIFGVDYGKHWKAAVALLHGASVYTGLPLTDPQTNPKAYDPELWLGFNYPQATGFTFVWLGFFTFETAQKIWKLFLLGCVVACWLMAWRGLRPAETDGQSLNAHDRILREAFRAQWWLTTAFLTAAFMPAISAIYIGNIDPYNAFLSMALMLALIKNKERLAGAIWALLTLVKLLPVALIVPVVLWRKSKVLFGFATVLILYLVLLIVTQRLGQEWVLYQDVIPKVPHKWRGISLTPARAILDFTGNGALWNDENTFNIAVRAQTIIFGLIYCITLMWLRVRSLNWMRAMEVAIVFYPIMTPLLEYHHLVWLMPAIYLQTRRWVEGRMDWTSAGGLFAGWVIVQIGFIISFQASIIPNIHYLTTFGFMMLIVFTIVDAIKSLRN